METAAAHALLLNHEEVDVEHVLLAIVQTPQSDARRILAHFQADWQLVSSSLQASLKRLPSHSSLTPSLSQRLIRLLTSAWSIASTAYSLPQIRTAVILLAALQGDEASSLPERASSEWLKLSSQVLLENLAALLHPAEGSVELPVAAKTMDKESHPALTQFTVDLTAAARVGALDPIFGRSLEIRSIIGILTRRRQNNPILVGEPGVGKTAIVEGFALRIACGDVPPALRNVSLRTLDLGLLLAGASVQGEFESRLRSVMNEAQSSPSPVILFIDEAHMLIGGTGQTDAANLLKPALARGDLRTIAATTHAEYRKYFEKDAALARRFQVVTVDEPDEEQAIRMLRPLVPVLERHHGVRLLDEAVQSAVRLSRRYIAGRQLPDKAVSLLDTACANVAAAQTSTPRPVEVCQDRISVLEREIQSLERERFTGIDHTIQLTSLFDELASSEMQLADLEDRLSEERRLVRRAIELRLSLESAGPDGKSAEAYQELTHLKEELALMQGDTPLVSVEVEARAVAEVVAAQTGIPIGRMLRSELHSVLTLQSLLSDRVIGQDAALAVIARRVTSARAGVEDPGRPSGVFLLAGPSGVGKTETALALSDILYGGERNAVVINMSEYQESHSVSGLKGAPPGYIGYGEGGILTEAVRRRPYCLLLLDEMEKAHQDVMELFYQVFDKGVLEDSQGRLVDFRNTLILMTSNVGSQLIQNAFETPPFREALNQQLRQVFKPAFLGRLIIVPYRALGPSDLRHIVELKLRKLASRLQDQHAIALEHGDEISEEITRLCYEAESGARNVDHILTETIIPDVSQKILTAMADGRRLAHIRVTLAAPGTFRYQVS